MVRDVYPAFLVLHRKPSSVLRYLFAHRFSFLLHISLYLAPYFNNRVDNSALRR